MKARHIHFKNHRRLTKIQHMVSNSSHLIHIHQVFCKMNRVLLDIQLYVIQTKARELPDKAENELRFTKCIMCQAQGQGKL